jgi:hypothetical protein
MLINKITYGFVVQVFDTEKKAFVSQEFVAGDQVELEEVVDLDDITSSKDDDLDLTDIADYFSVENEDFPFDMIQPEG